MKAGAKLLSTLKKPSTPTPVSPERLAALDALLETPRPTVWSNPLLALFMDADGDGKDDATGLSREEMERGQPASGQGGEERPASPSSPASPTWLLPERRIHGRIPATPMTKGERDIAAGKVSNKKDRMTREERLAAEAEAKAEAEAEAAAGVAAKVAAEAARAKAAEEAAAARAAEEMRLAAAKAAEEARAAAEAKAARPAQPKPGCFQPCFQRCFAAEVGDANLGAQSKPGCLHSCFCDLGFLRFLQSAIWHGEGGDVPYYRQGAQMRTRR